MMYQEPWTISHQLCVPNIQINSDYLRMDTDWLIHAEGRDERSLYLGYFCWYWWNLL